jgi:hypothetical protein
MVDPTEGRRLGKIRSWFERMPRLPSSGCNQGSQKGQPRSATVPKREPSSTNTSVTP